MALRISLAAMTWLVLEQGKGVDLESLTHSYWKHWYAQHLEKQGYKVWLEATRRVGRVDVLAFKDGESLAVEVETDRSTVVWNMKQDLLFGYDKVLVVATNDKALEKVELRLAHAGLSINRVGLALGYRVQSAQHAP